MPSHLTRRQFLQTSAGAGAAAGLGGWAALLPFSPTRAEEAAVTPDLVRFSPEIEPIVRLIEDTPREDCPAMMIEQLRKGLPYRHFLAALYLANIRTAEVNHPLAVLHSIVQLALDLPVQERLLPTFWAMDSFKAHYPKGGGPKSLKPLRGVLPSADQAENELHAGMKGYDPERAERAIAVLVRTQGAGRVAEALWRYGARDWFFIGHLPIWAANCWRPLEAIGWSHAEPILRVVVTSIVGDQKDIALQPYEANVERVRKALDKLPADWAQEGSDPGFVRDLLALWRESSSAPRTESPRNGEFPGAVDSRMTAHAVRKREAACELVAARLAEGKLRAGAVWDAVHLAAGEMIMCAQKGPEPGHAHTSMNALHFAFNASGDPGTRLLVLLQAVGWLFHFRENMADKGWLKEPKQITEIAGAEIPGDPDAAVEEILAQLSFGPGGTPVPDPLPGYGGVEYNNAPWRHQAASKAFTFARRYAGPEPLIRAAYRLLPVKATWDPHRIKFPIAAWENYGWVSREWRPHMLAAASYFWAGVDALDTDVARQVREAVGRL